MSPVSKRLLIEAQGLKEPWRSVTVDFLNQNQPLLDRLDACDESLVYPCVENVFRAVKDCSVDQVKVVILGQDPYHGEGQAHGWSFSVPEGLKIPPSLKNIDKEIHRDLGLAMPSHGYLKSWVDQGVFLLNTVLTVEKEKAAAHAGWGWEKLTDAWIMTLCHNETPKVFMLWGAQAQKKQEWIRSHQKGPLLILTSNHPSPLSALRGPQPFMGNGHWSRAQEFMIENGITPIDWTR